MYEPEVFKYGKYVSSPIEISHIIDTVIYLNISLFLSGLAFLIASKVKFQKSIVTNNSNGFKIKISSIYLFFILMLGVIFFKRVFLDSGSYGSEYSNISPMYKLVLMLFSYSEVYLMFLISLLFAREGKIYKKDIFIILGLLFLFLALFTFAGKKSAILTIVLYFLLIKLITQGDFETKFVKLTILIFLISIIFVLGFYFGKIYRSTIFLSGENILDFRLILYEAEKWGLMINSFQELIQKISLRINGIDPLTIILNSNQDTMSLYVNSKTTAQSFLNLILPGQPFDVINVSRTFPLVLEESILVNKDFVPVGKDTTSYIASGQTFHKFIDYELAKQITTTEMWTLEGINYAHFGYYGSIFFTAFTILLFSLTYSFVSQKNSKYKFLIKFVLVFMFYLLIQNFGYDNWLYYLVTWPLFLIAIAIMLKATSFFIPGRYIQL